MKKTLKIRHMALISAISILCLSPISDAQQQWHTYFDLFSNWAGSSRWFYQVDISKMTKKGDWIYGRERWKGNNESDDKDPRGWAFEVNCKKPSVQREGWVKFYRLESKWMVEGNPPKPLTGGLDPIKALWSFSCDRSW